MPIDSSLDIAAKIEQWRSQLLDTSKRNKLISFKSGRSGGVNLHHPGTDSVWDQLVAGNDRMTFVWKRDLIDEAEKQENGLGRELFSLLNEEGGIDESSNERIELSRCLESFRLQEGHLLTDLSDKRLASRLGSLALNARTALTEMGVTTLYLVVGLLRWFEREDSNVEFLAPLIFLNDADKFTLPIMLVNVRSGSYGAVDFGALQAGVVVAMIPALALYLVLQRYYVSGLLNGALRG